MSEKLLERIEETDTQNRVDNNMQLAERYFLSDDGAIYAEFNDRNEVKIYENNDFCY